MFLHELPSFGSLETTFSARTVQRFGRSSGYVIQGWFMFWADKVTRETRPAWKKTKCSGTLCYSVHTARGFIVKLQFLDSFSSFAMKVTDVSGGEFVMFFDTDALLANEVTCRSLFDERGRLYQVAPLSSRACCSKCDFTVSD